VTCSGGMSDGPDSEEAREVTFGPWFRREYPRVLGSLILAIGNRDVAEEATPEAFAKAYEKWDRVGAMASPGAWISTVALNVARRRFRRRAMEERLLLRKLHSKNEVPAETGFELWDLVQTLPPRERTAIVLRYVGDLREAEIAKVMGISAGGVSKTLNVTRSRLGITLRKQEGVEGT
jgi:RNA polymerase sigma factor (sigma-70 family)